MPIQLTADDRFDIQDLISRYAWALDTADVQGFVDCFATVGALVWDSFEDPLRWQGSDELRAFIEGLRALPGSAGRQHFVSNVRITGTAEGARAMAYVLVTLPVEGKPHVHVAGYYEDEFCLQQGAWRILKRTIRDWAGPIIGNFAGQTGERAVRARPPALDVLLPGGPRR